MRQKIYIGLLVIVLIAIGFVAYELLCPFVCPKTDEPQRYAGIEVGSVGVRYSIVTITKEKDGYTYTVEDQGEEVSESLVKDQQNDPQIQTKELIDRCEKILKDKIIPSKVPDENIFIALGSSYNRKVGNGKFTTDALGKKYKYPVEILSASKESLMEMKTLKSPPIELEQVLLVGIGSNSTKLGVYKKAGEAFATSSTYGVKDLAYKVQVEFEKNQAEKSKSANESRQSPQTNMPEDQTKKIRSQRLDDLIETAKTNQAMRQTVAELIPNNLFRSKKVIIMVGGLPCAILRQLGKLGADEKNNEQYSALTTESLEQFRKNIRDEFIKDKSFESKPSECGRFTGIEQIVGLEFVQLILDELGIKDIFFYERKTWLPGYLVDQAENKR
jgi:hypothetical protein